MNKLLVLAVPAFLMTCAAAASEVASRWDIGPVINGKNYSVGMPRNLSESRDGPSFDFPYASEAAGHVHYVTKPTGSLRNADSITLRYRIDAAPGTRILARERPGRPATVSLYFQRRGDNWSARGRYESYRWYVVHNKMMPLTPGVHEITVDFEDDWKAVLGSTAENNPAGFRDALAHADKVGFVFGSAGGRGHGVYATGPAKFTLLKFEIRQ